MKHDEAHERGRYADRPADMPWLGWKDVSKRCYKAISSTETSLRCAGVAFFSFLAVFPLLACVVLVYGLAADRSTVIDHMETLQPFMPGGVYDIVVERLKDLLSQPDTGLGIGLVVAFALALWSGSRGTNALILTINTAYREEDNRGFLASAALSLGMTLSALVFIAIALFAVAAIPILTQTLPFPSLFETLALWLRWPVLGVLVAVCMAILFRFSPHRDDASWRWLTPGAILATVLWLILSGLFSIYVQSFANFDATFGSLSVAVVMMLWLYYSTMIVSLGATLNAELEHQTRRDTTTGPSQPMGQRGARVADNVAEIS